MRRTTSLIAFVLSVLAASLAGVAAASALTAGEAASDAASMREEAPRALLMAKVTRAISATASDPTDDGRWAVRVGATDDGAQCVDLGRVQQGAWGRPIAGRFVRDTGELASACGQPIAESPFFVNLGAAQTGERNVIFGVADPAVASLSVRTSDGATHPLEIGSDGAFIGVFAPGSLTDLPVSYTLGDGRSFRFGWGAHETMARR